MEKFYTIQEVSSMTGIPSSTLRYYDKEGLLPFVERSRGGMRAAASGMSEIDGYEHPGDEAVCPLARRRRRVPAGAL